MVSDGFGLGKLKRRNAGLRGRPVKDRVAKFVGLLVEHLEKEGILDEAKTQELIKDLPPPKGR